MPYLLVPYVLAVATCCNYLQEGERFSSFSGLSRPVDTTSSFLNLVMEGTAGHPFKFSKYAVKLR